MASAAGKQQETNLSDEEILTLKNHSSDSVGSDSSSTITAPLTQQNLSHVPPAKLPITGTRSSSFQTHSNKSRDNSGTDQKESIFAHARADDADDSGNPTCADNANIDNGNNDQEMGSAVVGSPSGFSTASNASESNPYLAAGVLDPMTLPVDARRTVLILMFVLKTITSYDAGAFSIAIGAANGIESDLDIDSAQSGFLGSAVYLGNVAGCALCAYLFHKYDAKYLLCIGMMLHAIFTVLFALSTSYVFACFARIGIGFTLSFVVVYSVVWADVFSPKANATLWLAVLNIGVPVGTLAGFVVGGFIVNSAVYSWRWVFFVKSILMVPIIVFMSHIDSKLVDDPLSGTTKERVSTPQLEVWTSFLTNKLMIYNVAGLSVLYFVITGMQVFFTQYLRNPPFNASINDIMVTFGATAVSAPIVGVALGGYAMDKYGNYREYPDRAANLGFLSGTVAAVFGVLTSLSESLTTLSFNLWVMLFFGAAALPSAMGLIVAAVPANQKNAASSFANIMFNVWGYFAGPMVCGFVAQYTGSLKVAMTATLNMGWLGVVFFWGSTRAAKALVAAKEAADAAKLRDALSQQQQQNHRATRSGGSKVDFASPSFSSPTSGSYPVTPSYDVAADLPGSPSTTTTGGNAVTTININN